eukprot:1161806-Pelagomonas_calceolata.AAC.7
MFQLLRRAVHSSLQTIEPVATSFLHWGGFSCNACVSWLNHCPGLVQVLVKFNRDAGNIHFQTPQHSVTGSISYLNLPSILTPRGSLSSGTYMPERH